MRSVFCAVLLAASTVLAAADDAEKAKIAAAQKEAAAEAWKSMDQGKAAVLESASVSVYVPDGKKAAYKSLPAALEKYRDAAIKGIGVDAKEAHPGRITVFVFPDKETVSSFIRRVEKRRPMGGETGTFSAEDDALHVAVCPREGKGAPTVEMLAGEKVAAVVIQRRAGVRTPLPEWVPGGYGRAITHRLYPKSPFVLAEQKALRGIVKKRTAADVWGGSVEADEQEALAGSVMGVLAFGSGTRLPKILDGFKPGEDVESVPVATALDKGGVTAESLDKAWKRWVK